jgi:hypothetical protein
VIVAKLAMFQLYYGENKLHSKHDDDICFVLDKHDDDICFVLDKHDDDICFVLDKHA